MELTANDADHSLMQTAIKLILVFIMLIGIWLVAKNVSHVAPSRIVVNPHNLNKTQYDQLVAETQAFESWSFFSAPLPLIRNAVLELDWVSQAKVERDWQQGLVVTAQPRVAVAKFGSKYLIDAEGYVYVPTDATQLNNDNLVTLQGDRSQSIMIMQNMQKVNEWFAPANIKVQDMILTPRMTWLIRFDSGLRVVVDNENTTQKLSNLSHLVSNQLQPVVNDVASIDLRYKNGFALTWRPQQEVLAEVNANDMQ